MRFLTRPFCIFILVLVACSLAYAEDSFLMVHVANPKGQPVAGVVLSTKGDSSTGPATSNEGKTRIKLAPQTKPNSEVSLQIVKAPVDLVFVSPWDGRVRVPPFENESQNFVSIILIESGDRAWLEYGVVTLALVSKINEENATKVGRERLTDEQRLVNLADVAKLYGLKAQEVDQAIRAFGKKTVDPFELGQVALYERNYPEAEKQFLISKEERKKKLERDIREFADVNFSLGQTFYEQGKYKEAADAYQEVAKLRPDDSDVLNNLGVALASAGDYTKGELSCRKALQLDEKRLGSNHPTVATSLSNLAALYESTGRYKQAEPLYQRALTIFRINYGEGHPLVITSLDNLVQLYIEIGSLDQAITLQTHIIEICEQHLRFTGNPGYPSSFYIATLSKEANRSVSLHALYAANSRAALRLALTSVLHAKARSIDITSDQIEALKGSEDPQNRILLGQLSSARAQFSSLVIDESFSKNVEQNQAAIDKLEDEIERLKNIISERSDKIINQTRSITIERIQKEIPQGAALVEFVRYRPFDIKNYVMTEKSYVPRYIAYILLGEGEPQFVDLGEAALIDNEVLLFRRALRDPSIEDIKQAERALDSHLMQPIRKVLGATRHLFISPDGALNLIPFSALLDEQQHYLIENYLLTYLTSGRYLLRLHTHVTSKGGPVVIAGPLFDAHNGSSDRRGVVRFLDLPMTVNEARYIERNLPAVRVIIGSQATETALKQLKSPSILHIATHGFFLPSGKVIGNGTSDSRLSVDNPLQHEAIARSKYLLRSGPTVLYSGINEPTTPKQLRMILSEDYQLARTGLALTGANNQQGLGNEDGKLTALEAIDLDLSGTKLVILSAAYTGLGEIKDGDGIYGFRRALEVAGAESLITSLWGISDEGTQSLMAQYYKFLRNGEGRGEALRHAQLSMLLTKEWHHPFFWAAFIQSGDWTSIDEKYIKMK